MKAAYQISVDGNDVSSAFAPILMSLIITDSAGGAADTLEIEIDDTGGRVALPATGANIEALLWWEEPPPGANGDAMQFTGKVDEVRSRGAREHGRTLSIMARSADFKGKGKHKTSKYKDNASFGDVAKEWGSAAGYQVSVDSSLASAQRDYWVMPNESFLSWGRRIAEEIGATFKVAFPKAVFVPRNSGDSASGEALAGVTATWGLNLISWDVSPTLSAGVWANAKTRFYDHTKATWGEDSVPTGLEGGEADLTETFKAADQGRAKDRSTTNAADAKRKRAAVSIEMDGDPAALSQANLTLSGARPGIDGDYRIKTARHSYSRSSGWTTTCDCEQPQGAAGTDSRDDSSSSEEPGDSYNPLSSGGAYSPGPAADGR